jgi:hypothetical protein
MKTMKRFTIMLTGVFMLIFATEKAEAQNPTATATANATANIITPITITKNTDLSFGNIIANSSGGTVTIATNSDVPTYSGVAAPSTQGTRTRAEFKVQGMSGVNFHITLPEDDVIELTGPQGATPMSLDNFGHNSDEVLTEGTNTFQVGATLNVNADQATGEYSASFPVTVSYE